MAPSRGPFWSRSTFMFPRSNLFLSPKRLGLVVLIHTAVVFATPFPIGRARIAGGSFQTVCRHASNVTPQIGIVLKRGPGHGIVILAYTEEPAKANHCVGYFPTQLVDHHPLDGANLILIGTIHSSALDLVTANQRTRLPSASVCHDDLAICRPP